MKYLTLFVAILLLGGCASKNPAPVYEIKDSLVVKEQPEPKRQRPQQYRIRKGDTLVSIALEYGLDYKELALWNGIANPNSIQADSILRLSPPANAPTVAAVPTQKTAPIKPATQSSQSTELTKTPTLTPTPKSEIIGGTTTEAPVVSEQSLIKTAPIATKYPYSAKRLKALQTAHASQQVPSAVKKPEPIKPNKPAEASSTALTTPAALKKSRRRFDVDWSWPAAGKVILKFSESSKGLDIAGKKGDGVYAAASGKVVYVGTGVKSYGRLIILKHKNDYLSAYAHNEKILVKEGQSITRGQPIAIIGDSGTDNVMLHLEIRKAGKPFDPLQVLPNKR